MEESEKRQCLKKRNAEKAAAITQEQMTASQRATQINGRDIHGNLAFNHNNQTPSIVIHYHNGVPASITPSPVSSISGQAPPTPKTSQPEIPRPISNSSQDDVPPLSDNREDDQNYADTEKLTKASHFVESGLEQTRTLGGEKGIRLHSLDGASKEFTPQSNDGHGIGDQRQQAVHRSGVVRRRKLGIGLMAVVLLIIAGIVTGVVVGRRKSPHSTTSVISSTSSTQITSNTTGIGTAS
jgi:hypothetical protein